MKRPLAIMMSRIIKSIDPDISLCDAAKMMKQERIGCLLVEEHNHFVGVVSESDLVRRGMAEGRDPRLEKIRGIMSSPIISIEIDRAASEASDMMSEKGVRHLGVTDGGKIVGILSVRDLLRYYKNWGAL